jgi:hypothetical protein
VLILISIAIAGYGLYLATNGNLEPGIVLAAAGVFSFYLSLKISDLKDRLDWAKAENQKLAKKAEKSKLKPEAPKLPKERLEDIEPQVYVPEPPPVVDDYFETVPEESIWVEPDPAPAKHVPLEAEVDPPRIVTRTSRAAGGYTQETWKGERTWSRDEVSELIELYSDGDILDSIAIKMRLDKKDVVYKLTRLTFGDSGDLEDLSEAPNDGKAWSKQDSKKLLEMNGAGITLNGMAKTFGRTKLAIGWRLADQRELRNIG